MTEKTELSAAKPPTTDVKNVQFRYSRSNLFRSVAVDGASGHVKSDRSGIRLVLYSTRPSTPVMEEFEVTGEKIGKRVKSVVPLGFVREIEVEIEMTGEFGVRLSKFLQQLVATVNRDEASATTEV